MEKSNVTTEIAEKLQSVLVKGSLLLAEPMSKHTTFKIGGPADYFVMPAAAEEVSGALKIAKAYNLPITIVGNGSNMLVLDKGIRGLVLNFSSAMAEIRMQGDTIIAGAGALLKDVSHFAAEKSLLGMEFAVGIPGSIGGAVFMNAGAYEGDTSGVVSAVTAVCPSGDIQRFTKENLAFSYRHSCFQDNGCLICEVELKLEQGTKSFIRGKMDDFTTRRESKQPLEMPSAGSTFKRPPGHFAGTLIEQAGLKGLRVGGAEVSRKHAGFVVNAGGATAEDVLNLIKKVQELVYEHAGVRLEPEVRIIGDK
ncbi:MAG: UDP-N-acetylmuramate dehydrogenase [Pelosinus sp.]|nr:UDP-N-acetylmuramate dehydrogenase [Pelosinus sp.]